MSFQNEPYIDFTVESERQRLSSAINAIKEEIQRAGFRANPIINGQTFGLGLSTLKPVNPSQLDQIIGTVYLADEELTQQAIDTAYKSFHQTSISSWRLMHVSKRANIIKKAAEIMQSRKFELSARIILEVGKTWKEADADVAEAIDFCNYYAHMAQSMFETKKTQEVPGENNFYRYQPRGVSVVISPWNFPLAIACGMTVASLVTGNSVILKPAEQSSFIAHEMAQILYQAGVPGDVLQFLPGLGHVVGKKLVASPMTAMVCFTGSKEVGLEILSECSKVHDGQIHIKKAILELGGKNAIIVDDDADLDEAIKGILYSAYGFAGQKCSACSRLIVVDSAYQPLMTRLTSAIKDIIVTDACDPSAYLGPVIDKEAFDRIKNVIENGKNSLKLLGQGSVLNTSTGLNGYFIPPTIFYDVPLESSLWREEIFGPVVCATPAKDFTHALSIANDCKYALTGGLYSRNPKHIEMAKEFFEVGNLYINRGCTGAMVERQPFGGFKLSGIGSKAGGIDYLQQFVEPRTITENTMRRGFAG